MRICPDFDEFAALTAGTSCDLWRDPAGLRLPTVMAKALKLGLGG